jgi:hypothetical protein
MECLESKILKTEMVGFWCVNIESWKLKFEICMWNVWNLKIWQLKCLNCDVWIFQIEISMWNVWNLRIWKLKCLNLDVCILKVENWKLKSFCEMSGKNLKIWKLKCLNTENWNV